MSIDILKQFISTAPKSPGVYTFRTLQRRSLYIGKAMNIRSRLSNYLPAGRQAYGTDTRIQEMIRQADTITFQTTDSDIEALILESQLIKKHLPPFNIVMRDDKQYAYVGLGHEDFPKIFMTHQPVKGPKSKVQSQFIGPFTDAGALRTTLKLLRKLFPYCTCKQKHHVPCLNAHMRLCLGICCLKTTNTEVESLKSKVKSEYRKNIRAIREILSGKRATLIKQLEKEMKMLGKSGKFEEAQTLQKKIARVKRIFQNAAIIARSKELRAKSPPISLEQLQQLLQLEHPPRRIEGYDIANIQGQHATGSMVVFIDGQPDKNQYRKFNIKTVFKSDDTAMLKEVLARRFNHPEWPFPDLIIVDGGAQQLRVAVAAVSSFELRVASSKLKTIPILALTKDDLHRGTKITISASARNSQLETRNLTDLPQQVRNLLLHIDDEAHRFAINQYRKMHGKAMLTRVKSFDKIKSG